MSDSTSNIPPLEPVGLSANRPLGGGGLVGAGASGGELTLADLVFVGFNSRVVALNRYSGEIVWQWKSPKGTGYPSIMLDGDRLIVSVMGYTYCLDPLFGQEAWRNELKGLGAGIACVASVNAPGGGAVLSAGAAAAAQAAAAQQAATTAG